MSNEMERLRAENAQMREALRDLIDRWSTERGYDGAIQRARALLVNSSLRSPSTEDVQRAVIRKGLSLPTAEEG